MGWNEPAATPADAESNRGYAAMDRHFPANRLLPRRRSFADQTTPVHPYWP